MNVRRFVSHLAPLVLALSLTLAGQAGGAAAAPPPPSGTATIVAWNAMAVNATLVGKVAPAPTFVDIAFAQAAVYDAVVAIQGGYKPYHYQLSPRHPDASIDAAAASAAHDVLLHSFPAQQAALDALLATSLAGVADGASKTDGIAIGQASAASLIAFRQGDGFGVDNGFVMPAPAIGVFQLPAGQSPLVPWVSQLRPLLLDSPDQFRPGPPPALNSAIYAISYNETKYFGGASSQYRTPDMTDTALFWTSNAAVQYNTAFQGLATSRNLSPVQAARLFAMTTMIGADGLIACWDAKYNYLAWRPQFAIPQGDLDGNPFTTGDPTWKPLAPTPPHPEYPSAHGCASEGVVYALMAFLGTSNINIDITATVPNLARPTRHYQTAAQLIAEVGNARVWGGMHFRFSVNAGVRLGQHVAVYALQHYFQRTWSDN